MLIILIHLARFWGNCSRLIKLRLLFLKKNLGFPDFFSFFEARKFENQTLILISLEAKNELMALLFGSFIVERWELNYNIKLYLVISRFTFVR